MAESLFVDRIEKEKQTIVIEIEAMSSQLETAIKAKVRLCFSFLNSMQLLNTFHVTTARRFFCIFF